MRVMAVDYGDARTGVALSDARGLLVGSTWVVRQRNAERAAQEIAQLAREHDAERLVVGFPHNMDGTPGARAALYEDFAARLSALTGLETVLWDERRTSIDAHRILSQNGKRMKQHRDSVDAVAASLILEGYLQFLANRKETAHDTGQ